MTDTNDDQPGEYNPSGDIPSHPADPQYGEGDNADEDAPESDSDE